jgi:hypothetical protein
MRNTGTPIWDGLAEAMDLIRQKDARAAALFTALDALVATWRESAAWEADANSNYERAGTLDQCADEVEAALLREPPEAKPPMCAEGFHVAEDQSTTHRRCRKCGYEWDFPESKR